MCLCLILMSEFCSLVSSSRSLSTISVSSQLKLTSKLRSIIFLVVGLYIEQVGITVSTSFLS